MTATIDQALHDHGGRGESKESGISTEQDLWNARHAELADIRAQNAALLAKLDADAGVTDADYSTTVNLAAPQLLKGT